MAGEHLSRSEPKRYDGLAAAAHIPEMVQRIVDAFDPQRIILFGSHARGDAHRWSDIDLLVVFDTPIDVRERTLDVMRLFRDLLVAVDVVVVDEKTLKDRGQSIGTVYRPALQEGRVIYERSPS